MKGWREEGENEKGSRRSGREHGDSVITFTLPDTAVRLTLIPSRLPSPLSRRLSAFPKAETGALRFLDVLNMCSTVLLCC